MNLMVLLTSLYFLSSNFYSPLALANDPTVVAEIEKNIAEIKKKMEVAQDTTKEIEKNIEKAKGNLSKLDSAIGKRNTIKEKSMQLSSDYNTRISEAEKAKKDFIGAIEKDRKELALVRRDIVSTKQKLGALEAAEKALQESIEISEENLDKISNSRVKWGQNKGDAEAELQDVAKDLDSLKADREEAQKVLTEQSAALQKWRQTHVQLAKSLQDLTLKLKALKRD